MKPALHLPCAADPFLIGLLLALAGCTSAVLRQDTSETVASTLTTTTGIVPPRPLHTVTPEYPFEMKRAGIPGMVKVTCLIDETGRVREARVDESSHAAFEGPALDAVRRWKFTPATRDGVPIATHVALPVKFLLAE